MKNLHDACTWEIALLTPLHIGDGVELKQNLDYVSEHNRIKVIDQELLLERLQESPRAVSEIGRQGFRLDRFAKEYKIELNEHYTLPVKGGPPQNFRRFIKNAYGMPYIAGSSLKGAIRTALWMMLDRSSLPRPRDYRDFEAAVKKLQGKDPHHDFLRPLQVSDSGAMSPEGGLEVNEVKFFNIRHNNQPGWKDFSSRRTLSAFADATGVFVESLKSGVVLHAQASIDQHLQIPQIQAASGVQKIKGLGSLGEMAKAINSQSLLIAQAEKVFFEQFGTAVAPAVQFYQNLISEVSSFSGKEGAFITRLAWGSGWRGMTGDWLKDDDLDVVRKRNNLGKNGCPKCQGNAVWDKKREQFICKKCQQEFKRNEKWFHPVFPKTRRLALKDGVPCLPLGWVRIRPLSKNVFWEKTTGRNHKVEIEHSGIAPQRNTYQAPANLNEPATIEQPRTPTPAPKPEIVTWESATLVWTPNNQTITATSGDKKAFVVGKDLVPEQYRKRLFDIRKSITATIDVEPIGNGFRITKIY